MASVAVASATAAPPSLPIQNLSASWIRRGHVALPPSPGRHHAVTVAAAGRRSGDGGRRGKRRRRARGAEQEDGLSLSSEMEATNSTPPASTSKGSVKPVPEISMTKKGSAIRRVTLVVLAAVFFGVSIALRDGVGKASEYFAGYLLEQSLSVDNLFVFVLVFKYFKVPQEYQNRVLSYGIAGAVVFRTVMITLGVATIQRFEAVNLLLALILLFTSYKVDHAFFLYSLFGILSYSVISEMDIYEVIIVHTSSKTSFSRTSFFFRLKRCSLYSMNFPSHPCLSIINIFHQSRTPSACTRLLHTFLA
ncbi:hypothetical protein GUJ93_ZPchr0005g16234 [Zizania palustris]|uniref:Uncharacterized protein n=1 Tax=Zizania palustris TaxID=103762 RepID=A0A8J5SLU2_ZIZPA|nr:hypothetical protein GUJ93_ZPchr0005g16234 [Zizania palustris]